MNMLQNISKEYSYNRGASIIGGMVGLIIGIVMSVAVAIPVTEDVVTSANLTGTTKTIVEIIPVFVALIPMVLVAGFIQ
jgi:uncharacterized protein YacL